MGMPTELWSKRTISCSECSATRVVESHHEWDPDKSHGFADEKDLYPPHGLRLDFDECWEFRFEKDSNYTWVKFVCGNCVAREKQNGKEALKA